MADCAKVAPYDLTILHRAKVETSGQHRRKANQLQQQQDYRTRNRALTETQRRKQKSAA
jgi:hypothetical protein